MRKYQKYKETEVKGIPAIPKEWVINKIKFVSKTIAGGTPDTKNIQFWENGTIPWLPSGKVHDCNIYEEDADTFITELGLKGSAAKLIPTNSILIALTGATCANIAHLHFSATANQSVVAMPGSKKIENRYLFYCLLGIREQILINKTGGAQSGINDGDIKNTQIPYPSLPEQHAIVRFLDYKTGQIDTFIANRQKQIELLKEQKAGIINKAVTKGINPNAKMKDSGIEWIGEVPNHWMIGKVRRVLDILTDFTANGSFADLAKNVKYLDTPDYSRLIRLTDLRENLKNEGIYVNKDAHKFLSKSELFGGEILMANVGAYAGLVCLVPKLDYVATLGPNMLLLKFNKKRMSNQFAFTLLGSDCYHKLLMNKALSSAQPKLNKEDVRSIDFIFPPTQEEQKAILDWIKEETSNVDTLISKYQKQIDLMQEYRTSLISQAVTGKIDVREWQPKKQQTA